MIVYKKYGSGENISDLFELNFKSNNGILAELKEYDASENNPVHAKLLFEKDGEKVKMEQNRGDGKDYAVSFVIEETQSAQEYKTFMWIAIFTVVFGLLLITFLKKLKKLTHGAEDHEGTNYEEAEGFELADIQEL